jgi:hypothetical protein
MFDHSIFQPFSDHFGDDVSEGLVKAVVLILLYSVRYSSDFLGRGYFGQNLTNFIESL